MNLTSLKKSIKKNNMEEFRVMDKYGYTIARFKSYKEALDFCKNTNVVINIEDWNNFETIYKK